MQFVYLYCHTFDPVSKVDLEIEIGSYGPGYFFFFLVPAHCANQTFMWTGDLNMHSNFWCVFAMSGDHEIVFISAFLQIDGSNQAILVIWNYRELFFWVFWSWKAMLYWIVLYMVLSCHTMYLRGMMCISLDNINGYGTGIVDVSGCLLLLVREPMKWNVVTCYCVKVETVCVVL